MPSRRPQIRAEIVIDDSDVRQAVQQYNKLIEQAAKTAENVSQRIARAGDDMSQAWTASLQQVHEYALKQFEAMSRALSSTIVQESPEMKKQAEQAAAAWTEIASNIEVGMFGERLGMASKMLDAFGSDFESTMQKTITASDEGAAGIVRLFESYRVALQEVAQSSNIVNAELREHASELSQEWTANMAEMVLRSDEFKRALYNLGAEGSEALKALGASLREHRDPKIAGFGEYLEERGEKYDFEAEKMRELSEAANETAKAKERETEVSRKAAQVMETNAAAIEEYTGGKKKEKKSVEEVTEKQKEYQQRILESQRVAEQYMTSMRELASVMSEEFGLTTDEVAQYAMQQQEAMHTIATSAEGTSKRNRSAAKGVSEAWLTVIQEMLAASDEYEKSIFANEKVTKRVFDRMAKDSRRSLGEVFKAVNESLTAQERVAKSAEQAGKRQRTIDQETKRTVDAKRRSYLQLRDVHEDAQKSLEEYTRAQRQANREEKESDKTLYAKIRTIRDLRWQIITFMFFIRQASMYAKRAWETFVDVTGLDAQAKALRSLSKSIETDIDAIAASLDEASDYSLGWRKSMEVAISGVLADMGEFASRYAEFWEAAEVASVISGEEVEDVFKRLVQAIAEGDAAAVDAVMPFYNAQRAVMDYAEASGRAVDELDRQERQQIIVNQIMDTTNDLMETSVSDAVGLERAIRELKGAWLDFRHEMVLVALGTDDVGEALGEIIGPIKTAFDWILKLTAATRLLVESVGILQRMFTVGGMFEMLRDPMSIVGDIAEMWENALEIAELFAGEVDDVADEVEDSNQRIVDSTEDMVDEFGKQADIYAQYNDKLWKAVQDRTDKIEDLETKTADKAADIWQNYYDKQEDNTNKYYDALEDLYADSHRKQEEAYRKLQDRIFDITQQYENKRWDILQDFEMSMWEAIGQRDATAALKAQRRRDLELQKLDRWYEQQKQKAEDNYDDEIRKHEDYLEDRRAQIERDRKRRERDLEIWRRRQVRDLNTYYDRQLRDINTWFDRQLRDIRKWLTAQWKQARTFEQSDLIAHQYYLRAKYEQWLQYYGWIYELFGMDMPDYDVPSMDSGGFDGGGGGGGGGTGGRNIYLMAEGGSFVADRPQMIMVGEGNYPELVQVTPIQHGTQRHAMSHNVSGRIDATASGMEGRLTAAVTDAVLSAMRKLFRG